MSTRDCFEKGSRRHIGPLVAPSNDDQPAAGEIKPAIVEWWSAPSAQYPAEGLPVHCEEFTPGMTIMLAAYTDSIHTLVYNLTQDQPTGLDAEYGLYVFPRSFTVDAVDPQRIYIEDMLNETGSNDFSYSLNSAFPASVDVIVIIHQDGTVTKAPFAVHSMPMSA